MEFKFVVRNGVVNYLMIAGERVVGAAVREPEAHRLCTVYKVQKADQFPGYPIKAGAYYFEGEFIEEAKTEETPKKKTTRKKKVEE